MFKIQLVCQKCGNTMELCGGESPEQTYYNHFGYLEETSPEAINIAIQKIINDFENKPFQVFEFI